MEYHIQKMSMRQIWLYGKSFLINTLILAQTTFLTKAFPVPEKIIQKIDTNIFYYLCQNKTPEPIARKTLFRPKNKGGLKIKESEAHNLTIRIKHLLTLTRKKDSCGCI